MVEQQEGRAAHARRFLTSAGLLVDGDLAELNDRLVSWVPSSLESLRGIGWSMLFGDIPAISMKVDDAEAEYGRSVILSLVHDVGFYLVDNALEKASRLEWFLCDESAGVPFNDSRINHPAIGPSILVFREVLGFFVVSLAEPRDQHQALGLAAHRRHFLPRLMESIVAAHS